MAVPILYFNDGFYPETDVRMSVKDAGFVSGATIVDNARTYNGRLFRWRDHQSRLRRDCERCFVPLLLSDDELSRIAEELLRHNLPLAPHGELHVVTAVTPGPPGGPPTLVMSTYPIRAERYRTFFTEGVVLVVAGTHSIEPDDLLPPSVKHRSRLHWHIAERRIAERHPGAVPVVLNQGVGDTAIGAIAGVAADGTILLPPPERVQESISLKVLSELEPRSRVEAFSWWSNQVSELVLVGTGFGIAGVRTIIHDERTRDFDWPGRNFSLLIDAWSQLAGVDIRTQFRSD